MPAAMSLVQAADRKRGPMSPGQDKALDTGEQTLTHLICVALAPRYLSYF